MWIIGKHKNIINFIGGCTQGGKLTAKRCLGVSIQFFGNHTDINITRIFQSP